MEKKRKKKSGVDLTKTLTSPSAPPPPVEEKQEAAAAAPPAPTSTPALSEANAEAVLAKIDLARISVPKVQAAVEINAAPREDETEKPAPVAPTAPVAEPPIDASATPPPIDASATPPPIDVSATPPPVDAAATETPPPASLSGGPVSKKKSSKKKKKSGDRVSALPATTREPALERASQRKIATATEPLPKAKLDEKLEKLDQKLQEKKVEAEKAARAGFASSPDIDDISVPPVDLDEHDDHFFAAGDKGTHRPSTAGVSGGFDVVDPQHARKMTAEAKARRAHLSRYVKGAVIAAAALLLLGFVVSKLRSHDEPTPAVQVTHAPDPIPPPPLPTPSATQDTQQAVDMDEDTTPAASASAATSAAPDTSAVASAAPSASTDKPAKTAMQEKLDAKALLEREAYGAAVAAGERSVALDSSDGEAWLILGAAYQGMGNNAQAKRCYTTCTKQKRGPIGDCQQMLQQ